MGWKIYVQGELHGEYPQQKIAAEAAAEFLADKGDEWVQEVDNRTKVIVIKATVDPFTAEALPLINSAASLYESGAKAQEQGAGKVIALFDLCAKHGKSVTGLQAQLVAQSSWPVYTAENAKGGKKAGEKFGVNKAKEAGCGLAFIHDALRKRAAAYKVDGDGIPVLKDGAIEPVDKKSKAPGGAVAGKAEEKKQEEKPDNYDAVERSAWEQVLIAWGKLKPGPEMDYMLVPLGTLYNLYTGKEIGALMDEMRKAANG